MRMLRAADDHATRLAEDYLHERGWPLIRVQHSTPTAWLHAVCTRARMPRSLHGAIVDRWVTIALERARVHGSTRRLIESHAALETYRATLRGDPPRHDSSAVHQHFWARRDRALTGPYFPPLPPGNPVHRWRTAIADLPGVLLLAPIDRATWKISRILARPDPSLLDTRCQLLHWLEVIARHDPRLR